MNGLGINKASKNDKDTNILTPEEVALLRAHASDGMLTAEERETYSKHLEAMKKLMPDESKVDKSMPDESEVDVLGLRGREGIDYRRFGDARLALRHQRVSVLDVHASVSSVARKTAGQGDRFG